MKTLRLMGVALLTTMICACSGNKAKEQTEQVPKTPYRRQQLEIL